MFSNVWLKKQLVSIDTVSIKHFGDKFQAECRVPTTPCDRCKIYVIVLSYSVETGSFRRDYWLYCVLLGPHCTSTRQVIPVLFLPAISHEQALHLVWLEGSDTWYEDYSSSQIASNRFLAVIWRALHSYLTSHRQHLLGWSPPETDMQSHPKAGSASRWAKTSVVFSSSLGFSHTVLAMTAIFCQKLIRKHRSHMMRQAISCCVFSLCKYGGILTLRSKDWHLLDELPLLEPSCPHCGR